MPDAPNQKQQVLAKLDTAADISAIPLRLLMDWKMQPESEIDVAGFDTAPTTIRTYTVGIELSDARIRRSEIIPISEDYALIGRDILNSLYVDLEGPELTFEMRTSRS